MLLSSSQCFSVIIQAGYRVAWEAVTDHSDTQATASWERWLYSQSSDQRKVKEITVRYSVTSFLLVTVFAVAGTHSLCLFCCQFCCPPLCKSVSSLLLHFAFLCCLVTLGGTVLTFTLITYQETLDALAEMYSQLNEEDMWGGLWQQRCRYSETATAIAYWDSGILWTSSVYIWTGKERQLVTE